MKFRIEKEVFEKFPNIIVYLPIFFGMNNASNISASKILEYQKQQEDALRSKYSSVEKLQESEYIKAYFDCFKTFGIDPTKSMPTHYALAKRVVNGKSLPNINPAVNLYNAVSIKYLTPFGGEDLSQVYGDLKLSFAKGKEHWLGIGETVPKSPEKGNLIWSDDYDVSTVSLNWRQCDRTKLVESSKDGYFIMDGFAGINEENIKAAAEEFSTLCREYLGGEYKIYLLSASNPEIELEYVSKDIIGKTVPSFVDVKSESLLKETGLKKIKVTKAPPKVKQALKYVYPEDSLEYKLQGIVYQSYKLLCETKINSQCEYKECGQEDISISKAPNQEVGDYSTNFAFSFPKNIYSSPVEYANLLVEHMKTVSTDFEYSVANPGFINFKNRISQLQQLIEIISGGKEFGSNKIYLNEVWDLEHTSPNPNKALHIGHLRNNVTGMAIARLGEFSGAKVIYDCIDNDRGIALAKLMWGFLKFARKDKCSNVLDMEYWNSHQEEWIDPIKSNLDIARFVDDLYVKGAIDFDSNKEVEQIVRTIVVDWEAGIIIVRKLWRKVLDYSYAGQKKTLKRLGNRWDNVWHESDHYDMGKAIVLEGVKNGIFKEDQDAIISDFEKYNIPNTIIIKKDGTSLYITQDIALNKLKKEKFHANKLFWVVGPEQALALKQLFVACEQLGIGKIEEFTHLPYGYMSIAGQGKMSSRKGNVLYIDDLIDEAKEKIKLKLQSREFTETEIEDVAEKLAVSSLKYAILKVARMTDIAFDLDAATDFNGDSAIYILYSLVRARSILNRVLIGVNFDGVDSSFEFKEKLCSELLNKLMDFKSIVRQSIAQFSPNTLALYLFQLSQTFNRFYDTVEILKESDLLVMKMKLQLVSSLLIVVLNGCNLLGLEPVEKM